LLYIAALWKPPSIGFVTIWGGTEATVKGVDRESTTFATVLPVIACYAGTPMAKTSTTKSPRFQLTLVMRRPPTPIGI
jgi:hypothetical protein